MYMNFYTSSSDKSPSSVGGDISTKGVYDTNIAIFTYRGKNIQQPV
jgi:hypothetical protein